jgi:hypothetical protein
MQGLFVPSLLTIKAAVSGINKVPRDLTVQGPCGLGGHQTYRILKFVVGFSQWIPFF